MDVKDEKIKIVHVLNRMETGGIQSIVLDYFRNIDSKRFSFDFMVSENSDCPFEEEIIKRGAKIIKTPPFYKPVSYYSFVFGYLKKNHYDIVHSHVGTLSLLPLLAAYKNGIKVRICHIHSITDVKEGLKALMKVLLRPLSKAYANVYFACGQKVARWMYGNDKNVFIMENAINVDRFRFDESKRKRIRKEYEIPEDGLLIGHIGWFIPLKNQRFLVDLIEKCKDEKIYLMLIGGGRQLDLIKQIVRQKGLEEKVRFVGLINDTSEYYSAFDVFCLPSLFEGMPVVTIEAQANGLPTIISDSITSEAARNDNCIYLSLNKPAEWINAFHNMSRTDIINIEDVKEKCLKLENKYIELIDEFG